MWRHGWGFWLGAILAAILLCNLLVLGVVSVRYLLQRDDTDQPAETVLSGTTRRPR